MEYIESRNSHPAIQMESDGSFYETHNLLSTGILKCLLVEGISESGLHNSFVSVLEISGFLKGCRCLSFL